MLAIVMDYSVLVRIYIIWGGVGEPHGGLAPLLSKLYNNNNGSCCVIHCSVIHCLINNNHLFMLRLCLMLTYTLTISDCY